jgi:TetR/AcrR family transcriptional regulator, cholesterol catabolism regulator
MSKTETVDATRARILETAAALFREKGYDGTSMNELARRIGITAPGLYWHFSSKAEILTEYLEASMLDLLHITGSAAVEKTPTDKLRAFVSAHVRFQVERLDRAKVYSVVAYGHEQLKQSLDDDQQSLLRTLERKHLGNLERILQEGMSEGSFDVPDIHSVGFALLAMGEHAIFWFRPNGRLSAGELADLYGDLAIRMVCAKAP